MTSGNGYHLVESQRRMEDTFMSFLDSVIVCRNFQQNKLSETLSSIENGIKSDDNGTYIYSFVDE